jgi:hypothetical protein
MTNLIKKNNTVSDIMKSLDNKATPEGKQMAYRIALEMVNNDLEPTPENIELTFKNILKRKSKTIEEERNIVRSLLKPEIMAKVDKRVKLKLN